MLGWLCQMEASPQSACIWLPACPPACLHPLSHLSLPASHNAYAIPIMQSLRCLTPSLHVLSCALRCLTFVQCWERF